MNSAAERLAGTTLPPRRKRFTPAIRQHHSQRGFNHSADGESISSMHSPRHHIYHALWRSQFGERESKYPSHFQEREDEHEIPR